MGRKLRTYKLTRVWFGRTAIYKIKRRLKNNFSTAARLMNELSKGCREDGIPPCMIKLFLTHLGRIGDLVIGKVVIGGR